jgi:hypothetical protein
MVQIIATREIQYAGKRVLAGESFDATEKDAKIYVAVKRATLAGFVEPPAMLKTMAAPAPAEPVAPAAEPVDPAKEEAAPDAPAHPQTYSRRDMTAAGPTGPANPSPSSRRGHPRKAKT